MIFDKLLFLKNQTLLKWFSNTNYGKGVLGHGLDKVDLILPNAVFKKEGETYTAEFRTHDKYSKRLFYEYKPIWKAFHWFDEHIANVYIPKLNLGFDTLTVFPDANPESTSVDGRVWTENRLNNFSDIRNAASADQANDTSASDFFVRLLAHASSSDQFAYLGRSLFLFDTSSLSSSATIDSSTISFFGTAKTNGLGANTFDVVSSAPASNTAVVVGDYDSLGTTVYGDVAYASYSTSAYNDITLDANGISNISKTGISKFGTRLGWDTDNSFGGSWSGGAETSFSGYYADQTGTDNDPKLVVNYTLPAGGNPMFFGGGGVTVG